MDIIFLGTPDFAVPSLIKLNSEHNIKLVVTQPDRINRRGNKISFNPVKQTAIDLGLEVYQPDDVNSEESIEYLSSYSCDMIVVVAYGQMIRKAVRELPKINIVNIHASLLPKYRGAAPINWVIIDREEVTGVSIMQVSAGLDSGDVYLTRETSIGDKTYDVLYEEMSQLGAEAIHDYMNLEHDAQVNGVPQDDSLSTHAPKIDRELGKLDFSSMKLDRIYGLVKGLSPKPGAHCVYDGETMKILNGRIVRGEFKGELGTIVSVDRDSFSIGCNGGLLIVDVIQMPNKKAMSVEDYLKGNTILVNSKLE